MQVKYAQEAVPSAAMTLNTTTSATRRPTRAHEITNMPVTAMAANPPKLPQFHHHGGVKNGDPTSASGIKALPIETTHQRGEPAPDDRADRARYTSADIDDLIQEESQNQNQLLDGRLSQRRGDLRSRSSSPFSDRNLELRRRGKFRERRSDRSPSPTQRRPSTGPASAATPWCLRCNAAGHIPHKKDCKSRRPRCAMPRLNACWRYYREPTIHEIRAPTTMVHIKNIAHQMVTHCNQFDGWIKDRDHLLRDVHQYLRNRLDPAACEAWISSMSMANIATQQYLLDIQTFIKDIQTRLVHGPLVRLAQIEARDRSISEGRVRGLTGNLDEVGLFLHDIQRETETIRINQVVYGKMLQDINRYRNRYSRSREEARNALQQALQAHGEKIRHNRTIEDGFRSLLSCMPDPGSRADVIFISDRDFPLPDIANIRRRWEGLH